MLMLDETESQLAYKDAVQATVMSICESIFRSSKANVRVCIITFRDYQPNDHSYANAVRVYEFTSDIRTIRHMVNSLQPFGGGDGPEAQTLALYNALKASWNEDAKKIAILVTDSPPHGIGEQVDDFPRGSPEGK